MKTVAASILSMLSGDLMQRVIDRSQSIDDILPGVMADWSFDLTERKPRPALLKDGVLQPTDLDLASFLAALAERHAVINLPVYRGRRPRTVTEGERIVSKSNRHGNVLGLTSNQNVFSFGVTIKDANVVRAEEVGAPRTFMVVDIDGTWHDGWKTIEFSPTAKENNFLTENKLWTGNRVVFENFTHPNRWTSFYGQYYFLTKAVIARLEEETSFYRTEHKRLNALGFALPTKEYVGGRTERGPSDTEEVAAFACEIDAPWCGNFVPLKDSLGALETSTARVKYLQYTVLPVLRFATRATEHAFYGQGKRKHLHTFPAWIQGATWDAHYVAPGKQIVWNRLVLAQLWPGQTGYALRCRTYPKKEVVASEGTGGRS